MNRLFLLLAFAIVMSSQVTAEIGPPKLPPPGAAESALTSDNPLPKMFSVYSCHGKESDVNGSSVAVGLLVFCNGLFPSTCPAQIAITERGAGAHLPKLYKVGLDLSKGYKLNGDMSFESRSMEYVKVEGLELSGVKLNIEKKNLGTPKVKAQVKFKAFKSESTVPVECNLADYKK